MKTFRPCLAEFIGTFYLCFPGIAAILATKGMEPAAALVVIAFAHGLGLTMAVAFAPILRLYDCPLWLGLLLPPIAAFYMAATIASAVAFWRGRAGHWKGRFQAAPTG